MLVQDADFRPLSEADLKVVTKRQPTGEEKRAFVIWLESLQAREVETRSYM